MEDKIYKYIKHYNDKTISNMKIIKFFVYLLMVAFIIYLYLNKMFMFFFVPLMFPFPSNTKIGTQFIYNEKYNRKHYKIQKEIVVKKYPYKILIDNITTYYIITKRDNMFYIRAYYRPVYEKVNIGDEIYIVILDDLYEKDIPLEEEMMNKKDIRFPLELKNINNKNVKPISIDFAFIEQDLSKY